MRTQPSAPTDYKVLGLEGPLLSNVIKILGTEHKSHLDHFGKKLIISGIAMGVGNKPHISDW